MILFESARELLRESISDCFSAPLMVNTPDGQTEIQGYIRKAKAGEHVVYRLLSSDELPEGCSLIYQGVLYFLAYDEPLRNVTDSQLVRQYIMMRQKQGENHNGWSEY